MLTSLPGGDPNPKVYPIEDAPHGAQFAYPNMASRKTQARELAVGRRVGVRRVEVFDYMDEEVKRWVVTELAGRECLYVVTIVYRMFLVPRELGGERMTHTVAAAGADVVAAGQVNIDPAGRVVKWDHLSGHYRPDERQSWEVAAGYFTLSGLRDLPEQE